MRRCFEEIRAGRTINQPRRRLILPTGSVLHQMAGSFGNYFATNLYSGKTPFRVQTGDCGNAALTNYLNFKGNASNAGNNNCDNCDAGTAERLSDDARYPRNADVRHAEWGHGVVMGTENDRVTVLIDDVGYKTLALQAL